MKSATISRRRRRPIALISLALVGLGQVTACAGPSEATVGGPTSPASVSVSVHPSAPPIGEAVRTGVFVGDNELVLYFWGSQFLEKVWRDRSSGQVRAEPVSPAGSNILTYAQTVSASANGFFAMNQLAFEKGPLIEYGALHGLPSRIAVTQDGTTAEAFFTNWSFDRSITIFWVTRQGPPIARVTQDAEGRMVHGPETEYPLVTAYLADGEPLAHARIIPVPAGQKGS